MAADGEEIPIWDRKNPLQGGLVSCSEVYHEVLTRTRPAIISNVDLGPLWSHLRALGVVTEDKEEEIKCNGIATRTQQMGSLLDHLQRGPTWRLHAFCRACVATDQAHIVSHMELLPEDYTLPGDPPLGSSTQATSEDQSRQSARRCRPSLRLACTMLTVTVVVIGIGIQCATNLHRIPGHVGISWTDTRSGSGQLYTAITDMEEALRSAINVHRNNYELRIMTGVVFDIDNDDPDAEVTDLTKMYIKTDTEMKDENRINKTSIQLKDLFRNFDGEHELNTVKISGPAGTGKTTYLKHLAKSWSQGKLDWKLVIYVPAITMTPDIWVTIRSNLWCKEKLKDAIMEYIKEDGAGCLVMFDALDEVHDENILQNLQNFIDEVNNRRWPKVLAVARPELSHMNAKSFQRSLDLPGFSIKQGLDYISHCSMATKGAPSIFAYVNNNQQRLEPILSNPLHLHILFMLSTKGIIDLKSDHLVNTSMLLGSLEHFMITRQYAKQGNKELRSSDKSAHSKAFYRLCLFGIVTKQVITDEMMNLFEIDPNSPYHVFMKKTTTRDILARKVVQYSFPHMMIVEYFASRVLLEASSDVHMPTMLLLGSQPHLKSFFLTLLSMVTDAKIDIAEDMIKAFVAHNTVIKESKVKLIEASLLSKLSDANMFLYSVDKAENVRKVWFLIEQMFKGGTLNEVNWTDSSFILEIMDALRYHSKESQDLIFSRTVSQLLPTGRVPGDTLYAVGGSQIARVKDDDTQDPSIIARCPMNAYRALKQHMKRYYQHAKTDTKVKNILLFLSSGERFYSDQCPDNLLNGPDWERLLSYTLDSLDRNELRISVSDHTSLKVLLDSVYPVMMRKMHVGGADESKQKFVIATFYGRIRLEDLIQVNNKMEACTNLYWWLFLYQPNLVVPDVMSEDLTQSLNSFVQSKDYGKPIVMRNPRCITESGEQYTCDESKGVIYLVLVELTLGLTLMYCFVKLCIVKFMRRARVN